MPQKAGMHASDVSCTPAYARNVVLRARLWLLLAKLGGVRQAPLLQQFHPIAGLPARGGSLLRLGKPPEGAQGLSRIGLRRRRIVDGPTAGSVISQYGRGFFSQNLAAHVNAPLLQQFHPIAWFGAFVETNELSVCRGCSANQPFDPRPNERAEALA